MGDKIFGICPKFLKIYSIKLSSADANRHYPYIAEFQINAFIIKSPELLFHAALAKIYFFNAFPRAFYFSGKTAAANHMRVEVKFWEQVWYFAMTVTVCGNVINPSMSSKCGLRNVVKFKEQLNKKKLFARAFLLYYIQGECRKIKRLWVKTTKTMWSIFKLVILHYDCWKYSKQFLVDWRFQLQTSFRFIVKTKAANWTFEKEENIWTWLSFISKYGILRVEVLR